MSAWQCGLLGKHPASADYLCLGPAGHRLSPVFSWVRSGFTVPVLKALAEHPVTASWRFWMLPEDEKALICGVFSASHDRCGRPYPLLIAGIASNGADGGDWTGLAEACRGTWTAMTALSDATRMSQAVLTDALAAVPVPVNTKKRPRLDSHENTLIMDETARCIGAGHASRQTGICLAGGYQKRWQRFLGWQDAVATRVPGVPYSLFYCESAGHAELFYRPLTPRDGVQLMDIALRFPQGPCVATPPRQRPDFPPTGRCRPQGLKSSTR